MTVGGYVLTHALVALVLTCALIALLLLPWRRARGERESDILSDGAVLIIADGRVQQASPLADAVLGQQRGERISAVLQSFLGANAAPAVEAIARLEVTGDPVDLLVRSADGRAFQLIGAPAGALLRVVLREAHYLDELLRDSDARLHVAEMALRAQSQESEALHSLVAAGPMLLWRRAPDGRVSWSAGRIRTRSGDVTPEQAVEQIVRARPDRQPVSTESEPQKSRIEMMVGEGVETIALHVVEIVRPDGGRMGFATDAGGAAAAERTLSRFVQTMTETFAHLTVGLAIFDRNQTLALFNPALVQMWQVEPAWLARRPSLRDILDELRSIRRLPDHEDFHQWRARLVGLFDNTEAADYEELWHLADGSNIRVLARPHPHGALAFTFDDVTERMRLEQRYRHSIDLRRTTMDSLTEGIAVFGANGLLQFVNHAFHEIWGTDPDTVYAAMHARQLMGICEEIAGRPEVWQRLHGYVTGEEGRTPWTTRLTTNSGRELTARFAPLPDGSTLTVFSDITEAERISGALLDRDAALEMAETARASLGALLGETVRAVAAVEARLVAAPGAAAAPGPDDLADRLAGLRAALRDASAIAARPLDDRHPDAPADAAATLAFVAAILAPQAAEAGVALSADTTGAPARCGCAAGPLEKVAFRLASEAVLCAGSGGEVVLSAEGDGERIALHASYSAAPDARQAATEPSDALVCLVARHGGLAESTGPAPGGRARLTCRFQPRQPGAAAEPDCLPAATTLAKRVHPLKPHG